MMASHVRTHWIEVVASGVLSLVLAGCISSLPPGTGSPPGAPASPASSAPAISIAAKPVPSEAAAASAKPAASAAPASTKPAASAAAKPAASGSAAAQPAASGLIPIKSSFTTVSPTAGPQWVAKEHGIFAKYGLDVSLTSVVATAQVPALMANDLQFSSTGATEVASADLGGASLVMIAEGASLPIFSLYTDKKYKTVPDLAGQTIGVTSLGAASDTAAHLFLRKFNMEDKVKITGAGGSSPAILAAMSQGLIAGGILIPPVTSNAADAGYVELVNGPKLGVPLSQGSIVATRSYIKDHEDVVRNFLKAYLDAWAYCSDPANKADMVKILEQYTKTDEKASTVAYDFMLPLWQSQKVPVMQDAAVANVLEFSADPKVKGADAKQFFDNTLIQAVSQAK